MTHRFTGHEIELANGQPFNPAEPDSSAVDIGAVAHALGNLCRYGGHCQEFTSVAEHAVLVATKLRKIGATLPMQFAGLHHDDAESLNGLGDPQRPAKDLLGPKFRERETMIDECVWRAVACKYDPPLWMTSLLGDPLLKAVDSWALGFEAKHLMISRGIGWEQAQGSAVPVPTDDEDVIRCLSPVEAKKAFLAFHFMLVAEHVKEHGGRS